MNPSNGGPHRRRAAVMSALLAGAVVVASGCTAAPAAGHTSNAATARSHLASQTGVLLGPGRIGQRSAVPWRLVGPGWTLAQYAAGSAPLVEPRKTGPVTLYLIDPRGGRYRLYQWPAAKAGQAPLGLVDWSGDKTRALFSQQAPDNAPWLIEQITLATGQVSTFRLPWQVNMLGYTKPDGRNVLTTIGVHTHTEIARYNLNGQRQKVLASGDNLTAVQSADGTALAVSAARGLVLVSNAGGVIRRLPVRGSGGAGGCFPARWWNASTILAGCLTPGTAASRLWLVPADGGRPAALTRQRTGHGVDPFGDIGAWRLPGGLYLQALGACGTVFIVKQEPSGLVRTVSIPGTAGNNNRIVGAYQSRLLVQAQTGCPGSDSLLWFNPATRVVQTLLSAPKNVIGVVSAVPFGRLHG